MSDLSFVYAVNAAVTDALPLGTILWSKQLTSGLPANGTLSTPMIDAERHRIYVTSAVQNSSQRIHALDLRNGDELAGWPVAIDPPAVNAPCVNAAEIAHERQP